MPSRTKPGLSKVASKDSFQRQLLSIMPYMDVDAIVQIMLQSGNIDQVIPQEDTGVEYPSDPVEFMTKVLKYKMWSGLENICNSVQNNPYTIVESGFGLGKSITCASLVIWWMATHDPSLVITIAPSWAQVNGIVWSYIRESGRRAGFSGILETPRWKINDRIQAYGLSPRKSSDLDLTTLQGRHNENLLVILDEAAGLPRPLWDTVRGLAVSKNNKILAVGNPIEQAGPFWDASQNPMWSHIRLSCLQHPNVIEGTEVIPGAVTREWVDDRCIEWAIEVDPYTPESIEIPWNGKWFKPLPIFLAKVLGIAPEMAEDQLIKLSWVSAAQDLFIDERSNETVIGFDPAPRGGDDNAMCIRRGNKVISIKRRKSINTIELVEWLQNEAAENNAVKIYVDDVGPGIGVTDYGRKVGLPIVAVNFSKSASQKKRFANLRAECWWRVRELLREGKMELPRDRMLEGDLVAPKFSQDNLGRILLESKDDIRLRINRSPDSGDALALTYAIPLSDIDEGQIARIQDELTPSENGWRGSRWFLDTKTKKDRGRWKL